MSEIEFTFLIERDTEESEGFVARCLELKGVYGQGETEEETINDIQKALDLALEYYKEKKIEIPYRKFIQVRKNVSIASSSS